MPRTQYNPDLTQGRVKAALVKLDGLTTDVLEIEVLERMGVMDAADEALVGRFTAQASAFPRVSVVRTVVHLSIVFGEMMLNSDDVVGSNARTTDLVAILAARDDRWVTAAFSSAEHGAIVTLTRVAVHSRTMKHGAWLNQPGWRRTAQDRGHGSCAGMRNTRPRPLFGAQQCACTL